MNREELLTDMREDYKKKDLKSLKRHFTMGQWLLQPDDKVKIERAINMLEKEEPSDLIKYALKVLGGRIVD